MLRRISSNWYASAADGRIPMNADAKAAIVVIIGCSFLLKPKPGLHHYLKKEIVMQHQDGKWVRTSS
jgi:hypothetical protein